ncbi:PhiH1 repressor-like protein [Natrinema gari]|uniref:PhiH1 repressor-like protein n=1 Tax=Natrinema gari JCM 14663 TaxID=1230459 RepID=L9Z8H0_9EURY|nr:PhiH1 repressor-like protein [Natrinema gari]ELY81932.1 PhiH1 repressor-like protein [Natrinema gari JCM 14663]
MRQEAEWMVPSDDKILELIREYGNLTPTAIEDLGGPSAGHARNRCPVLAEYGLLDRISRGLYGITDDGEAYLAEKLDASELEPTEDTN